jgi:hypothetical protein
MYGQKTSAKAVRASHMFSFSLLSHLLGSGLTHKQRSLVIIVIFLLCYIALGALILSVMLKLNFIDALYLAVVSIETIGMFPEIRICLKNT